MTKALLTRECTGCGKAIRVWRAYVRSRGNYCSRDCWNRRGVVTVHHPRRGQMVRCPYCSAEFYCKPSHILKRKCCSRLCTARYSFGPKPPPQLKSFRRRNAVGRFSIYDVMVLRLLQADRCNICNRYIPDSYEIDHIYPLSRGGTNWPNNLQLLCRPCNASKWAKVA